MWEGVAVDDATAESKSESSNALLLSFADSSDGVASEEPFVAFCFGGGVVLSSSADLQQPERETEKEEKRRVREESEKGQEGKGEQSEGCCLSGGQWLSVSIWDKEEEEEGGGNEGVKEGLEEDHVKRAEENASEDVFEKAAVCLHSLLRRASELFEGSGVPLFVSVTLREMEDFAEVSRTSVWEIAIFFPSFFSLFLSFFCIHFSIFFSSL